MNTMEIASSKPVSLFTQFEEFILGNGHPCLMAQSVVRQKNLVVKEYGRLGDPRPSQILLKDLEDYLEAYNPEAKDFYTFIAAFQDQPYSEDEFEKKLWQQLQNLHNCDPKDWDEQVDSDPNSLHFSFSLLGHAFYIVGMHPNSSRLARRSPRPCLVFNLHEQFEKLRNLGAYETTRSKIRERDTRLQGSVNPMLNDFGHSREAMQYSGRTVGSDWKCPFNPKNTKT